MNRTVYEAAELLAKMLNRLELNSVVVKGNTIRRISGRYLLRDPFIDNLAYELNDKHGWVISELAGEEFIAIRKPYLKSIKRTR